mmetsp:Transcript_129916/g.362002  ORF Transcript_129916/g.362002 Transcript_129916/m.362002 type:complete len:340 (+) Transcript_129916:64-1083(+)
MAMFSGSLSKRVLAATMLALLAASAAQQCSGDRSCAINVTHDQVLLQVGVAQRLLSAASLPHQGVQADPGDFSGVQRRRRAEDMGSCRRRHSTAWKNPPEEAHAEWQCQGTSMVWVGSGSPSPPPSGPQECTGSGDVCLCVFDIDRTLTGKQDRAENCPRNRVLDLYDEAYGGGRATLSALAADGISTTFCNQCHLGITSAGTGSGAHSEWNRYLLDYVMRGEVHDAFMQAHPSSKQWSYGTDVHSPYVLDQGNRVKQEAVELVRRWYGRRGVCISPSEVYFFGDRTENILPFRERGLNSREISCGSRDKRLYGGSGLVGYCGARPEEIQRVHGNVLCD